MGANLGTQSTGFRKTKYSIMGCVYCVTCNTYKETLDPEVREVASKSGVKTSHYIGMSAFSLHNRQKTHREQHAARNIQIVMVKHEIEKHRGSIQSYTIKLVQSDRGLLHISLREALVILGQLTETSMNDRKEKGNSTGIV